MGCRPKQAALAVVVMTVLTLMLVQPAEAAGGSFIGTTMPGSGDALNTLIGRAPGPVGNPGEWTPNQLFASKALSRQEAMAACGPAAAVAFAKAAGSAVTLDRAVAVAREVGWTPQNGMTGPWGELALLQKLGVNATLASNVDRERIARELKAGRPVIIRTGGNALGHYFVAERIDSSTGKFDFGQSALILRSAAGRRWLTLDEIGTLGVGTPTHTLFLNTGPASPAPSAPAVATAPAPSTAMSLKSAGTGNRVVSAGGSNARLRATPGLDSAVVGLVADGSRVTDVGVSSVVAGRTWRKVTTSTGVTAWIDGGLLSVAR